MSKNIIFKTRDFNRQALSDIEEQSSNYHGREVTVQESTSPWNKIPSLFWGSLGWMKNKAPSCPYTVKHPIQTGMSLCGKGFLQYQAWGVKSSVPDEKKLAEIRSSLGQNAVKTGEGLAEFTIGLLEGFNEKKVVDDLIAKGAAFDQNSNPVVEQQGLIPVYINSVIGSKVLLMADREWIKENVVRCLLVGFNNLKKQWRQRSEDNPSFLNDSFIGLIRRSSDHVKGYPKEKESSNNKHLALTTKPQIEENRKIHEQCYAKALIDLMYPGGMKDLPVEAKYQKILYDKMEGLVSSIVGNVFKSLKNPQVLNRFLFQALNRLPKPEELRMNCQQSSDLKPIPELSKALGDLLTNVLVMTPTFGAYLKKLLGSKSDQVVRETIGAMAAVLVQSNLQELLVPSKKGEVIDPDKCLDSFFKLFNETWLARISHRPSEEDIKSEQVIKKAAELRKKLPLYLGKILENKIIAKAVGVNRGIGRFLGWVPIFGKQLRWLNFGAGMFAYLGWQMLLKPVIDEALRSVRGFLLPVFYSYWKKKRDEKCRKFAEQLVEKVHHPYHEHLIRDVGDLVMTSFDPKFPEKLKKNLLRKKND